MLDHAPQRQNRPGRGRPRRQLPRRTVRIYEWRALTGWSRSKIYEWISTGKLSVNRPSPEAPQEIFASELVRLGYFERPEDIIL